MNILLAGEQNLLTEISQLVEKTRMYLARSASSVLVMMYWQIGCRINQEILKEERAEYGEQIVRSLAQRLSIQYGSGFDRSNLFRMSRLARLYPDEKFFQSVSQQLTWTHLVKLIAIDEPTKRDFYTEMCQLQGWSVRVLRKKINTMLYERTALAKQPEPMIKAEIEKLKQGDLMNPDLYLQDPCVLKFLYPRSIQTERDLESAILSEMQAFIQEMGTDFCFLSRQKRMSTDKNDRFLDLLFFHRGMKRLIAIELKLDNFQPEHAGQMEWYLKWLDKYERRPGEEQPLGIIICAGKDQEDIELMELGKNGIHVAQYLTELPPKEIFEEKLRKAIELAREKYTRLQILNNIPDKNK